MRTSVCVIIVTRNRVDLLRKTVVALNEQDLRPSSLVVVDNGSSDGTHAYLASLRCPFPTKIILQDNLGGAGGFARGLQEFLARSEDWAWLMDDDGRPAPDALQQLYPQVSDAPLWRNCLVLDEGNSARLAFGLSHRGKMIATTAEAEEIDEPITQCNPFNGTLLHRSLVQAIGLPIAEFFIKGDETEYQERTRRYGFSTQTYTASKFFHPALRERSISDVPDDRAWVYFYKIRNHRATAEKDGTFRFNLQASAKLGLRCAKEILLATLLTRNLRPGPALHRLHVVLSAVCAAALNSAKIRFVPTTNTCAKPTYQPGPKHD